MKNKKLNLQMFADEFVGLISKGTVFSYQAPGSTEYLPVAGVRSAPEIGTTPEEVDATDLMSERMQSVAGLEGSTTLEFTVKYKGSRFAEFDQLSGTREQVACRVIYPDGAGYDFTGQIFIRMSAAEVNGLLESVISVVVSDGPTFSENIATP